MSEVVWLPIKGYEGLYEVSSGGEIRNAKTRKIHATHLMGAGYVKAALYKDGKRFQTSAHKLVAEAFLDGSGSVNHKNGVKSDNRVENLEWVNKSENELHSRYVLGNLVKPVVAINPISGERLEFPSINSTAHSGFLPRHVYSCVYGLRKTHGGFMWEFIDAALAAQQSNGATS